MRKDVKQLSKEVSSLRGKVYNLEQRIKDLNDMRERVYHEDLLSKPLTNLTRLEGLKESMLPMRELVDAIIEHLNLEPQRIKTFTKLSQKVES